MIEIFGAEWCTGCKQAKTYCETKGFDFRYIDIDNSDDERVKSIRSLPTIYIDGKPVGGLKEMMTKVS